MPTDYDAVLLVSFGGPEGPADVMPFLENVLRGRNVPRERMLEVAKHYEEFGGVSPINQQNRALIAALEPILAAQGPHLPIYWGNRNWHPLLTDTLQEMQQAGIKRALAVVTSAFSCYSGCRQYREDIARAREAIGPNAPSVDKMRVYFNHPGFVIPMAERVREALHQFPEDRQANVHLVFTAHSIPVSMADGSKYVAQLEEAARLVCEELDWHDWKLVYQSRSGSPTQTWLEPDICDYIKSRHQNGDTPDIVIVPIGFVSDHMEVLFDLDAEATELCGDLGIGVQRAGTVGTHPLFVQALRDLIEERVNEATDRVALGSLGPSHDVCPEDCCLSGRPARS